MNTGWKRRLALLIGAANAAFLTTTAANAASDPQAPAGQTAVADIERVKPLMRGAPLISDGATLGEVTLQLGADGILRVDSAMLRAGMEPLLSQQGRKRLLAAIAGNTFVSLGAIESQGMLLRHDAGRAALEIVAIVPEFAALETRAPSARPERTARAPVRTMPLLSDATVLGEVAVEQASGGAVRIESERLRAQIEPLLSAKGQKQLDAAIGDDAFVTTAAIERAGILLGRDASGRGLQVLAIVPEFASKATNDVAVGQRLARVAPVVVARFNTETAVPTGRRQVPALPAPGAPKFPAMPPPALLATMTIDPAGRSPLPMLPAVEPRIVLRQPAPATISKLSRSGIRHPLVADAAEPSFASRAPAVGRDRLYGDMVVAMLGMVRVTGTLAALADGMIAAIDDPGFESRAFAANSAGRFGIAGLRPGKAYAVRLARIGQTFLINVPANTAGIRRAEPVDLWSIDGRAMAPRPHPIALTASA